VILLDLFAEACEHGLFGVLGVCLLSADNLHFLDSSFVGILILSTIDGEYYNSSYMSTITSIKQQKDKNRVNVYLDEEFGFGIDLDNFVILNLKLGQELTEDQIQEIVKKAEFQKTLEKIYRFATVRPRSEKEFKDWLYRKKVPEVIHKDLFTKLTYFEFLDDEKFTRFWIESRNDFRPKPKRVIEQELRMKGVGKEIIKKILDEKPVDERKLAKDLIEKRATHWEGIERKKRGQKILAYLVGKGFSFEIAKSALSDYNIGEDEQVN